MGQYWILQLLTAFLMQDGDRMAIRSTERPGGAADDLALWFKGPLSTAISAKRLSLASNGL
jgi:hypothetical protein